MNIFYGIAFLVLIYYLIQWKNISILINKKVQKQHNIINNKIQKIVNKSISSDISLIEGFSTGTEKIFNRLIDSPDSVRNNCNSMFLPNTYKGVYKNEINEGLFNYSSMQRKVNL
jgi:hypothetical protein